jgi:hypothetical protein
MDAARFDRITVALSGHRRDVLRALVAAAIGFRGDRITEYAAAGPPACGAPAAVCRRAAACCSGKCRRKPGKRRGRCADCRAGTGYCAARAACIAVGQCCVDEDCPLGHCCPDGRCRECCDVGDCGKGSRLRCCPDGRCRLCCGDGDCALGRCCADGECHACCGDGDCAGGQVCQSGACVCPSGRVMCRGACLCRWSPPMSGCVVCGNSQDCIDLTGNRQAECRTDDGGCGCREGDTFCEVPCPPE